MPEVAVSERILPHNLEAERSVLGAILLHNDAFNLAANEAQITELLHKHNFNQYLGLPDEQYYIKLEELSAGIKSSLEKALPDLEKNNNPVGLIIISIIRLSLLHYLTEKSAPNNHTKVALMTDLNKLVR